MVDDAFSPQAIRELEPRIRTLTSDLLDSALTGETGEFDLVDGLSYPLPVIVIADMLGVPSEERDQFKRWSDTIVRGADGGLDVVAEDLQPVRSSFIYGVESLPVRYEAR